jgi:hypothetical protein
MFKSSSSKQVTDFAIELAMAYIDRCPAGSKKAVPYVNRTINEICKRAEEFKKGQRLGVYGKANLATEFKHRLMEEGYEKKFVEDLTEKLVLSISGK